MWIIKKVGMIVSIIFLLFGGLFVAPSSVQATEHSSGSLEWTLKSFLPFETIEELVLAVLKILIVISVPIIVFFIIYAGFLYVTARGNAQQIEQATRAFTYAIIGAILIIGAVTIAEIVKNLVDEFRTEETIDDGGGE
jgi:hypothetical protein